MKIWILSAMVISTAFVLSSCSNDDEGDGSHGEIINAGKAPAGAVAIDLGLPSGIKWANMNIGATSPEDYGDYFAWGETTPKATYAWSNYKWCKGGSRSMTKYCTNQTWGTVDNKKTLEPTDDAAHVNWGGTWRMPTWAEYDELCNHCTWKFSSQNGVYGYKFTSKKNGKAIFLPFAGHWMKDKYYDRSNGDMVGYYLSSSLFEEVPNSANSLFISNRSTSYGSPSIGLDTGSRDYGRSVRAVCQ